MVESGFNRNARSYRGATGLWQFMGGTAKQYGLRVGFWADDRRDPYRSTEAAARYLRDLYRRYNDWNLTLAAYNTGPGNLNRALKKCRCSGKGAFWEISRRRYISKETRRFVPKVMAAALIEREPRLYGFKKLA